MAAFALLIVAKVVYIQFVQGDHWRERARQATLRYENIDAARGDIYSGDGRLLATSLPVYEIRMDVSPKVTSDELFYSGVDSLALQLSRLFGDRNPAQYKNTLIRARANNERYLLIKRHVSWQELNALKTFSLFRLGRFRGGLIVIEHSRREMPYKTMAARTIGYEREGVYVGLEGAYRQYLEGVQGKRLVQRSSNGWIPIGDQNEIQPRNGMDLVTTLNIQIQDYTHQALLRQLRRYNASWGTAVVMEVSTGKIRAISNLMRNPTNNRYDELYNFAIGQSTEPGSTFKLASMLVALEDGVVKPDDLVDTGTGQIRYYDRIMHDAGEQGHGIITMREAFELSSNVGISRIVYEAYRDKPQRFVDRLKSFQLDRELGLEIAGEGQPLIRDAGSNGWSNVSLPWMAIGYEVLLTPLQILSFYNAVANDGKKMRPMLVSEVRQSGRTVRKFHPQVGDRSIASASGLQQVRELLIGVVEQGTAKNIYTPAYPIAGKTGTAQVAQTQAGYRSSTGVVYQSSFAGFFPADNPAYSCIVVIHDPRGLVYTGGQVAAPVFREIADKIFAAQLFAPGAPDTESYTASLPLLRSGYLDDLRTIYRFLDARLVDQAETPFANTRLRGDTVTFTERGFIGNLVPEVVGMGLRDAIYVLENAGLRVRFTGRGSVRRQSMPPGRRVRPGSVILIELS